MTAKQDILQSLKSLKSHLKVTYKIKDLWLFGSFVRAENGPNSDVDLLVDFDKGADFFNLLELGSYLEEKLQRKVDIVSTGALRLELKDAIYKEMVAV